ncbi:MAG: Cache 3/Cache 2 fusion domain-containing protein [Bacteroidales bacterium]|nr:Cache 3/Cache 2 fusion domain-containing protein [Bacteroidales bacterium]
MRKNSVKLRLKLFLPVAAAVTLVVAIVSVFVIYSSLESFNSQLKGNLELEVATLKGMLTREAKLKQQQVNTNLEFAYTAFNQSELKISTDSFLVEITNQLDGKLTETYLKKWILGNTDLFNNYHLVDSLKNIFGGTITIFQRCDSGFVRISTNVPGDNGGRATATYIPNESEVAKSLIAGNYYTGRAFVVDDWYTTAYRPIFVNNDVVGAVYVGSREKDLEILRDYLQGLKIGKSGYPMVFDKDGMILIHPHREGQFWGDSTLFQQIVKEKKGFIEYELNGDKKLMAFDYFPQYEFYVAAAVFYDAETIEFRNCIIGGTLLIVSISLIVILCIIYFLSVEKIFKYLDELEKAKLNFANVRSALQESEDKFRTLFDSTGDDIFVTDVDENIVEINEAACKTLGYERSELLSKKISDIKSEKFKLGVTENRRIIFERGFYTFESEHVKKDGTILRVEFTSKVIKNGNETLILSIVRDISKRAESERQILSAMIEGEERERQRFAREMHDGLGPLLSALKLYVNELSSPAISIEERKELLNQCNELIDDAVLTTRTISNNLMPTVLQKYGLANALETFCEKVSKTGHLSVDFEAVNIEANNEKIPQLILFRIVSELINNTIKHANAKNVKIKLSLNSNVLHLDYSDDGVGFSAQEKLLQDYGGTGLKNIISRIKSINGTYSFGNNSNTGFSLQIEIII